MYAPRLLASAPAPPTVLIVMNGGFFGSPIEIASLADGRAGWLAQCFIKLFLPGCCIFGLLEATLGGSGWRYEASAAPLSVDIDCHLASPFPTGLVVPQNRFSQKTPQFPPREIAQEMKLPRKTY